MTRHSPRLAHRLPLLCAFVVLLGTGCKATYSDRMGEYRGAFRSGDYALANLVIDELLIEETGLDATYVVDASALAGSNELSEDDAWLLGLEKGMTALALEDIDGAHALFQRGKDELDRHAEATAVDYMESAILDDTYAAYRGYDHEVVLVRVMLALTTLLRGGADPMPAIGEVTRKQQELLDQGFGAESGYDYRALYPRIALGSYLEGVLLESSGRTPDAKKAYRRAREDGADLDLMKQALARVENGKQSDHPGRGVVHVIALLGGSPILIETTHFPTEAARMLAGVSVALVAEAGSAPMQVPIKVPQVWVGSEFVPGISIESPGMAPVITEPILDLNGLFAAELEAQVPWMLARAMVRRSLKAAAAATLERVVAKGIGGDEGDAIGFLAGATLNLGSTGVEDADTRSWTSLPSHFHVARLEMPVGEHVITFGGMGGARVKVAPDRDSFVVVIQPDPVMPSTVLVDAYSRISN